MLKKASKFTTDNLPMCLRASKFPDIQNSLRQKSNVDKKLLIYHRKKSNVEKIIRTSKFTYKQNSNVEKTSKFTTDKLSMWLRASNSLTVKPHIDKGLQIQ